MLDFFHTVHTDDRLPSLPANLLSAGWILPIVILNILQLESEWMKGKREEWGWGVVSFMGENLADVGVGIFFLIGLFIRTKDVHWSNLRRIPTLWCNGLVGCKKNKDKGWERFLLAWFYVVQCSYKITGGKKFLQEKKGKDFQWGDSALSRKRMAFSLLNWQGATFVCTTIIFQLA